MRFMRVLASAENIAMCLMLWALFLIVALQFFTRYVLNNSFGWTEEIARMLLVITTYLGAVVCARNKSHIRVDLIFMLLPEPMKTWYFRVTDLVCACLFAYLSWTAARFALTTRLQMSSIELPKSIIFWICAGSLLLMTLHYVIHLFQNHTTVQNPEVIKGGY
jgi:TRAP-type C4-dicarboxylate transport system permease small subunit